MWAPGKCYFYPSLGIFLLICIVFLYAVRGEPGVSQHAVPLPILQTLVFIKGNLEGRLDRCLFCSSPSLNFFLKFWQEVSHGKESLSPFFPLVQWYTQAPRSSNRRPEWNGLSKHGFHFFRIFLRKIHPEMAFGTRKNNLERIATVLTNKILFCYGNYPTNITFPVLLHDRYPLVGIYFAFFLLKGGSFFILPQRNNS